MATESIEELLEAHRFFAGLDRSQLQSLVGCGRNAAFATGDYLCREGEAADVSYIVHRGRVALEVRLPDRGSIAIDTAGVGEVVGASWPFPPYRWQLDARALEPVGAVALDAVCLRDKCDADPALGYALMKRFAAAVVGRMASARLRLVDVYGVARGE